VAALLRMAFGSSHPALRSMETWLREEQLGELHALTALVRSEGVAGAAARLEEAGFRPQWAADIVSQLNRL
jgi:hypothetical protein